MEIKFDRYLTWALTGMFGGIGALCFVVAGLLVKKWIEMGYDANVTLIFRAHIMGSW